MNLIDVAITEKQLEDAILLLRYFVAFHSPGDMPEEFSGGQMATRLAQARRWLAGFGEDSSSGDLDQ